MKKVAAVGIGRGKFGVRSDASLRELAFESIQACLDDAKITLDDVDAMVTNIAGDEFAFCLQPSAQIHDYIGFHPKPNYRAEGTCASGSMALRTGWMTVSSGLADMVLVVGVEKMTEVATNIATDIMGQGGDAIWEHPFGMTLPDYYAMLAQALIWLSLGPQKSIWLWIPNIDSMDLRVGMPLQARPHTLKDGKVTIILERLDSVAGT